MGIPYRQHATFRMECASTSRVLHSVVLEELKPATDLIAPNFLKIVFQGAQCHHRAWTVGIHHKNIALGNLMYSVGKNGSPFGILVDWDVAPRKDSLQINRNGTIPFMAVDFLRSPDEHVVHLYQHDLEALFWVLVWVCYPANTFAEWEHGTYAQRRVKKSDYLLWGTQASMREKWVSLDIVLVSLREWLAELIKTRQNYAERVKTMAGKRAGMSTFKEQCLGELWKAFCETLEGALLDMKGPEYEDTAKALRKFLIHDLAFT